MRNSIPKKGSFAAELTEAIIAKRNSRLTRTVKPTSVAGVSETIVLETPKANVLSFAEGRKAARAARKNKNRDMSWLLKATSSVAVDYRS